MTGGTDDPRLFRPARRHYPERELDRVTTFFRIIFAIPNLIVLATIGGLASDAGSDDGGFFFAGVAGGILFIPPLLLIVFREK